MEIKVNELWTTILLEILVIEWQELIEPEGGVIVHLLVVEDEAGLVVEHADEAVGGCWGAIQ